MRWFFFSRMGASGQSWHSAAIKKPQRVGQKLHNDCRYGVASTYNTSIDDKSVNASREWFFLQPKVNLTI